MLAIAVLLFAVLAVFAGNFLTTGNLTNVVRQISLLGIVATGMTFVIIAGEIDLSAGSMYGLLAIVLGELLSGHGWPILPGAITVVVLGAALGAFNGLVTTKVRIPSFIVTLGMLSVFDGLSEVITTGYPITGVPSRVYASLTSGTAFGQVPAQAIWMAGVMLAGGVVLARTRFGYQTYATGGNELAARNAGIRTDRIKIAAFVITGVLAAVAAVIEFGWLRGTSPTPGSTFELQIVAAVIIGGTSLAGGRGTIAGTLIGAVISGLIANGLVLLNVNAYWVPVAQGAIIVVAVSLTALLGRRGDTGTGRHLPGWAARLRPRNPRES